VTKTDNFALRVSFDVTDWGKRTLRRSEIAVWSAEIDQS
jgi:hypothetical protein